MWPCWSYEYEELTIQTREGLGNFTPYTYFGWRASCWLEILLSAEPGSNLTLHCA